ncbi:MAG: barstar family protein [Bacillota bacterium]|nr:barstar family protein [Bacillota bacterium]
MKNIIIKGSDIFGIADIHELIADALDFPEYYDKNLDALHDCLGDISEETSITLMECDILTDRLGVSFEKLMRVLNDTALENDNLYIIEV